MDHNGNNNRSVIRKLVYDYLVLEEFTSTAKCFLKDIGSDVKHMKTAAGCGDSLETVYLTYLSAKNNDDDKKQDKDLGHELLAGFEEEVSSSSEVKVDSNGDFAKKKRRRGTSGRRESTEGESGVIAMKEESQKQYTFGWKRYTEYCQIHSLDTLVGEKANPASQILEFARYLMHNPGKTVKAAVANSYVSAVGKRLLEANVISAMRDIRTPELKELFAEAGRQIVANDASTESTTIATASTIPSSGNDDEDSQETKKKKSV